MPLKQFDRIAYTGPDQLFDGVESDDVGFVIEVHDEAHFEVEFSRADGTTYALHVIPAQYLAAKPA